MTTENVSEIIIVSMYITKAFGIRKKHVYFDLVCPSRLHVYSCCIDL